MTAPTSSEIVQSDSDQDFVAALHEIKSNLEVRRLMFVLSNVLVPALAIALIDALTGNDYPAQLRWLPENLLPIAGAVLTVAGVLVTIILARCHFGLVVNGSKMRQVETGDVRVVGLNWLGVTTNFVALTALYAGAGLALLLGSLGLGHIAWIGAGGLFVVLLLVLRWNHGRANQLVQRLLPSWQHGRVSRRYAEEHLRESLDATSADVAVIVTMAVAVFSGTFNGMTNLASVSDELTLHPSREVLQSGGLAMLAGFTLVSLLLCDRMVVRLRIALAEHSSQLAKLRSEDDTPWSFRWLERTFLLYALLHLLTSASLVFLVGALLPEDGQPALWGGVAGATLFVVGIVWYPVRLAIARRGKS